MVSLTKWEGLSKVISEFAILVQKVEVEHVQDFQFWHVALWKTHYNGCHVQLFSFPCYGHWNPNLSVICDQKHGNSLRIYPLPCILYTPFCSTTRQCTWFGPRIKPFSFNLSLHQETKDKGRNDCDKRGKSLKKEGHSSPDALNHHVHAKSFLLWCVLVLGTWYTVQPLGMYHVPCTLYGCWSNCVIRK